MARLVIVLLLMTSARALADDAPTLYRRAAAAYALGRYAEAATLFEQSFALSNEPALLFDAAQAHRLAGDRARALALYRSYLRVGGAAAPHRAEVAARVARLQDELARAAAPPPTNVADRPAYRKPWFWATVGGAVVVVGLAVGLGVGLGTAHGPQPTLGSLPLN